MATLRKRGKNWFIVESYREAGKVKKRFVRTGVSDKRLAGKALEQYEENRERGIVGIADPRKPLRDRPAAEWLDVYLTDLAGRGTSAEYVRGVGRVLRLILTATEVGSIGDLTPCKVREYLATSGKGAATKNAHRTCAGGFFSFLTGDGKPYEGCPFTKHTVPRFAAGQRRAARRAFRVSEVAKLLDAAEQYPLAAKLVNIGGRPKLDGSPAVRRKPVKLSDASRAKLERAGRERRLIYRTALLTGLRRGELSRLLVRDVYLDGGRPRVVASLTKNKRQAVIPLVPGLATALGGWIRVSGRGPEDKLFAVPSTGNLSRLHQAQMQHASIPYRDANGVPATFHSLRRTVNVLLRRKRVPLPERMRFMRHAARDLTTRNYDDEGAFTMSARVFRLLAKLDAVTTHRPEPAEEEPPAASGRTGHEGEGLRAARRRPQT